MILRGAQRLLAVEQARAAQRQQPFVGNLLDVELGVHAGAHRMPTSTPSLVKVA